MTEVYIKGEVEKIVFHNSANMFYILSVAVEETDSNYDEDSIIVSGNMIDIQEDVSYVFKGELVKHSKYGEQLKATFYEPAKLEGKGLISYFASDQFKGIGIKKAMEIVKVYGDDPIDKILANPDKLKNISGLTKRIRDNFVEKLKGDYNNQKIISKLVGFGLSLTMATKVIKKYEDETIEVVEENPYLLSREVKGFSFANADVLAEAMGIKGNSPFRIEAAFRQILFTHSNETGDTYMLFQDLLPAVYNLLVSSRPREAHLISEELLSEALYDFIEKDIFYCDFDSNRDRNLDKIFLYSYYNNELEIATNVLRIINDNGEFNSLSNVDEYIDEVEEEVGFHYDPIQRQAIREAVTNKFFILTGGPGTGKTTVINGILKVYEKIRKINLKLDSKEVVLLAPTGKAARRMSETTGLHASTIHSALRLNRDNEDNGLELDDDILDCDLIIVDEFSMVDSWLGKKLFENVSSSTQVVIVGDREQLPSVGPGQVLGDFLELDELPSIRLQTTFRQGNHSSIVTLANNLKDGVLPFDFKDKKHDYTYFELDSSNVAHVIPQIIQKAIKSGYSVSDVQVLSPMYKGEEGINNLNKVIQNQLNPHKTDSLEFTYLDNCYRIGDKVLHLVNDIERGLSNGDVGYISDLIPAKHSEKNEDEILINFGNTEASYSRKDWDRITLAYAMSIHKSQGSEFPVVIMPITLQAYKMLQRNLVYTGITRAKNKLILLGSERAYQKAVATEGSKRNTFLKTLFKQELEMQNLSE